MSIYYENVYQSYSLSIMKTHMIIEASNVDELKSLGSYDEVKISFEKDLNVNLGVTDWESFFETVKTLKDFGLSNKEYLLNLFEKKTFEESKAEISKVLKVKIKAKNNSELKKIIDAIVGSASSSDFNPYEYYEKTKFKKFQDSSKLEGIDIEVPDENATLESVLEKYRR